MSNPTFVAIGAFGVKTNSVPGTSVALAVPSGVVAGDIMLAFLECPNTSSSTTPPAAPTGWSILDPGVNLNFTNYGWACSYIRVAGSSEPASYTWSWTFSGIAVGAIIAYRGANNSPDVHGIRERPFPNTSNTSDSPSISATQSNDTVVYAFGQIGDRGVDEVSLPGGGTWTLRGQETINGAQNWPMVVGDTTMTTPGAIPAESVGWSVAVNGTWGIAVALSPVPIPSAGWGVGSSHTGQWSTGLVSSMTRIKRRRGGLLVPAYC